MSVFLSALLETLIRLVIKFVHNLKTGVANGANLLKGH